MEKILITEIFNYNNGGINTSFEVSMYELEKYRPGNFTIHAKFENISLLRNSEFREYFFDVLREDILEAVEVEDSKIYTLVPSFAEISTYEGRFIDCYYENRFNEDKYLTGDGEIGKCLVAFDDDSKKNEISFTIPSLYYHNEIIYDDEYEEVGDIIFCVKDEFIRLLLSRI